MVSPVADEPNLIRKGQRLAALRKYEILDTPREATFDEIVRIAALVCDAPVAVVNLIDQHRQFFKAEVGLGVRETPVDVSICAHGLLQRDLFVVPDTTLDARFACNPLVTGEPHLRFYAGALLETPAGHPIGTVCVLDYKPRPQGVTPAQAETLRGLARAVMAHLELRRANKKLAERERRVREIADRHRLAARATNDAIWDWEISSGQVLWNQAIERQFGHPVRKTSAQWWKDRIHDEDRERVVESIESVIGGTGTHWISDYRFKRADGSYAFVFDRAYVLRDGSGQPLRIIGAMLDISERKLAEERQNLLMRELHHRVKNSLANVQAIAGATLRSANSFDDFRYSFADRLISLGKSHTLLTDNAWEGASLEDLVRLELDLFAGKDRVKITGPDIHLPTDMAVAFAMAMHELASNAARFGALSREDGVVEVSWNLIPDGLHAVRFVWRERNGPHVKQPERSGFGMTFLRRALPFQINGSVEIDFLDGGARVVIEAGLPDGAPTSSPAPSNSRSTAH